MRPDSDWLVTKQTLHPQETPMEIQTVIIIMFVVFCLFVLANWFNRPRK